MEESGRFDSAGLLTAASVRSKRRKPSWLYVSSQPQGDKHVAGLAPRASWTKKVARGSDEIDCTAFRNSKDNTGEGR